MLAETRDTLDMVMDKIEQNIQAENAVLAYDTQCVLKNIMSEIEGKIDCNINMNCQVKI